MHALAFKQYFAKGQHFTYDLDDIARYYKDYIRLMDYWKKLFQMKFLPSTMKIVSTVLMKELKTY